MRSVVHLAFLAFWLASPFWEAKAPNQWDERELQQMLTDSPWAQTAEAPGKSATGPAVVAFFATAAPIETAERERDRRASLKRPAKAKERPEIDPLTEEYRLWLEDNRATQIVLTVGIGNAAAFADEREVRRMEEESTMQIGRKKIKMTGHFPPTAGDPYLRLAFPRQVQVSDKTLVLDLYLPGVSIPYRQFQFTLKDMVVRGKLEL